MGQEIFSILLVDDEKNERKGIEKLIQKNGYPLEIFQAENGIEEPPNRRCRFLEGDRL